MKNKIIWIGILFIFVIGYYHFAIAQIYDIRVIPRNYNFGKVRLSEEKSTSIGISSPAGVGGEIDIANYSFTPNSSPDFRITSTPFSGTIIPGRSAYIEITFKPTSPGLKIATLSLSFRQGMDVFNLPVNLKGF